jgi:DNA-binding LytR/AlgR family response regulator
MTIRALIAEDEPILAQALRAALARLWPELEVVLAANGFEAVDHALAQQPDILFLDIKMPGKTGLEAAQELAEDWPEEAAGGRPFPLVVFVTAYDEYALQAFEQAAADYVLKPVSDERLGKTVARLRARLEQQAEQEAEPGAELARIVDQLRMLAPAAANGERLRFIRAAVGNQVRMIPVAEVLYFQATDKYLNVVTADGESLIRTSLKELLPQFDPAEFWQIHRGTVVNASRIEAAVRDESGKLSVRLRGCSRPLAVSRVFAHLFRQM